MASVKSKPKGKPTSTKQDVAKVGRPYKLDPTDESLVKLFYTFGGFRATHETMAGILDCSHDTIQRTFADEDNPLSVAYKKGFSEMKLRLSEYQLRKATGIVTKIEKMTKDGKVVILNAYDPPDTTMLIWLGKQYLGQKDRNEDETAKQPIIITLKPHKLADDGTVSTDY